jgi:hypothetical protein
LDGIENGIDLAAQRQRSLVPVRIDVKIVLPPFRILAEKGWLSACPISKTDWAKRKNPTQSGVGEGNDPEPVLSSDLMQSYQQYELT